MKRLLTLLIFFPVLQGYSQSLTFSQQEALTHFINYANEVQKMCSSITGSIEGSYDEIERFRNGKLRYNLAPYKCPIQLDDYYYTTAIKSSGLASGDLQKLIATTNNLRKLSETLDDQCKSLEVYFSLNDHLSDKFKKYDSLVIELKSSLEKIKKQNEKLNEDCRTIYRKLQPYNSSHSYHVAENLMLKSIQSKKRLLDTWKLNLKETIHTGWPIDSMRKNITDSEKEIEKLKQVKTGLDNYAVTTLNSFIEAMEAVQESMRRAIDDYNAEAQASDKHANDVYKDMINYYNGMLVADLNNFINLSSQRGFRGMKHINYFALYEIRTSEISIIHSAEPFKDIPYTPITVTSQATTIPAPLHKALTNYIDFINESIRQTENLRNVITNYNSSAMYYKDLTTFKGKGGLHFDPSGFKIPYSYFQKLSETNTSIPSNYRTSLKTQAEVMVNILKEIEGLSLELQQHSEKKLYEKDNVTRAYEILERLKTLYETIDERKEKLYTDIRKIHESYKVADSSSSWIVSARELLKLVDLDKEAMFIAKKYLKGDSTLPSSAKIDEQIRAVISKEYSNMKGIEKIGRSNGNCPYTPYENIPDNSTTFSEYIKKLKRPAKETNGYNHPYHSLAYLYNTFVEDYNKFCELSNRLILKNIHQPEYFSILYPDEKVWQHNAEMERIRLQNEQYYATGKKPLENNSSATNNPKVIHDTVYIEKNIVDTVYLLKEEDKLSLEGYATNNLVLLLDVSGSMNEPNKLPLMKKSLERLLTIMRNEDEISIVVYSGKASVALSPTSCSNHKKIIQTIESLKSKGTTNGNAGIELAYKVADKNYIRGGNNRIVLATDGEFPVSNEAIQIIEKYATEEIYISVFFFGKNANQAKMLKLLTEKGKGNFEEIKPDNSDIKLLREVKAKKN